MKISEQEYNSFFEGVELRDTVLPSTGEVFQMPLIGQKAVQMAAFFTASRSKVLDILPIPELSPIEIPGNQTLIGVVGIEYMERNIPGYNEVVVVIPVMIGKDIDPPTIEDLMKEGLGGCTLFVRHIVVNTRIATVVGNELLGYTKFMGDIQFIDMPEERICILSDAGEEILKFSVDSNIEEYGDYERNTMSVCTYNNNQIYRLTYQNQTRCGTTMSPKGSLTLGSHPLGKILAGLDVSKQPVQTLYSPYFQLLSDDKNLEIIKF